MTGTYVFLYCVQAFNGQGIEGNLKVSYSYQLRYLDGSAYQENSFFVEHPQALLLHFYLDEFDDKHSVSCLLSDRKP